MGSAHLPANGTDHYDYGNPQTVTSYAVDWMNNFPNLTGQFRSGDTHRLGLALGVQLFQVVVPPHASRGGAQHSRRLRPGSTTGGSIPSISTPGPRAAGITRRAGATPPASESPFLPRTVTANDHDDWAPRINASGDLVWYGSDGNDFEIYAATTDGSPVVRITDNAFSDEAPDLNASGRIVWQAFDGRDYEIYTAKTDGTEVRRITDNDVNDWHPRISDTGRIVWDRWDGEDHEIFSAWYDGTAVTQITQNSHGGGTGTRRDDVWPRINASDRVVWMGTDGLDYEIYSANADGSGFAQLTNNFEDDEFPDVSDGGYAVWHTWHSRMNTEVWCAPVTGGSLPKRLSTGSGHDWHPRINAQGDVVWMSYLAGQWEIMKSDVTGSAEIRITANDQHDQYPVPDDDGGITWQGFDGEDWEIYRLKQGVIERVTDNAWDDRWPDTTSGGLAAWHGECRSGTGGDTTEILVLDAGGPVPALQCDALRLSADQGADVELRLDAGPGEAFRGYLLFAGASGTAPGTSLPGGQAVLPLNWDALTTLALIHANGPFFMDFLGTLNAQGGADARFKAPGPFPPVTVGLSLAFAYALGGPFDFVSNAVRIEVMP